MKYYMIVVGSGRKRRIVVYTLDMKSALIQLNWTRQAGFDDANIVTTTIEPPRKLKAGN